MSFDTLYYHRDNCRLCRSTDVEVAIPLAPIPIKTPNLGKGGKADIADDLSQVMVPLDLYRCKSCGHIQILDVVNPELQYKDFRYRTSVSLGLPQHFREMAEGILATYDIAPDAFVLEVGSNDGTLLKAFQERGRRVLGVDPAVDLAKAASEAGIPTLAEFFRGGLGRRIVSEHGPADLVVSNNTFANLDDLDDIIDGVKAVLAPGGVFVVETGYGVDVIEKVLIDTVYHEHLSYFLVGSLDLWFSSHGMKVIDAQRISTKGGSLRVIVQWADGPRARRESVEDMIAEETRLGVDKADLYRRFSETLTTAKRDLAALVADCKKTGGTIAAYGASVGTVTLLHQLGLARDLAYICDDNPLADAIEGPDHKIPIVESQRLYGDPPRMVVILAVRYADPIIAKHGAYLENGGTFVVPLPHVHIVNGDRP